MSLASLVERNLTFSYYRAVDAREKGRVYDLRKTIWQESFPYLLEGTSGEHPAKDAFDDLSYIFCSAHASRLIGSCRGSPMLDGAWEISRSLPPGFQLEFDPATTLQLDRVYIRDGYRNIFHHEFLFYYFASYMIENTNYSRYFAVCNAELVRLYRRLGVGLATDEGIELRGRASHLYFIVEGDIEESRDMIRERFSLRGEREMLHGNCSRRTQSRP